MNYEKEFDIGNKFYKITKSSYQLCSYIDEDEIKNKEKIRVNKSRTTYSRASRNVKETKVICAGISFEVYAEKESMSLVQVEEATKNGIFGKVHVKDN